MRRRRQEEEGGRKGGIHFHALRPILFIWVNLPGRGPGDFNYC